MGDLDQKDYINSNNDPGDYDEWVVATISDQTVDFVNSGTNSDTARYWNLSALRSFPSPPQARGFDLIADQNIRIVSITTPRGTRTFKTPIPVALNTRFTWLRRVPHMSSMVIRTTVVNTTIKMQVF